MPDLPQPCEYMEFVRSEMGNGGSSTSHPKLMFNTMAATNFRGYKLGGLPSRTTSGIRLSQKGHIARCIERFDPHDQSS